MIVAFLTLMLGLSGMDSFASEALRVVSYNVNFYSKPELVTRDIQSNPKLANADVILLQEVTRDPARDWDPIAKLGQALGMQSTFIPSANMRHLEYGNGILSRYPLKNIEMVALPHSEAESKENIRSGMIADIELPSGISVTVASVHLSVFFRDSSPFDQQRAEQLEVLLKKLKDRGSKNIIFGGDFNTATPWAWAHVHKIATHYAYSLSHPHKGWTMKYLHLKLDHLFHQGDMKVESLGVSKSAKGSDHIPIWVNYQFSVTTLSSNPEHF